MPPMKPGIYPPIITDIQFLRQISLKTSEAEAMKLVPIIKQALLTGWCFGYGLAAVQIGVLQRMAWFWTPVPNSAHLPPPQQRKEHILINPVIIEKKGLMTIPGEGCLSMPGKTYNAQRYSNIIYENNGERFAAEGLEAQIIQHEVDHMDGILVVDREYHSPNVGRNDPCPCGSGKKYKKCCLSKV